MVLFQVLGPPGLAAPTGALILWMQVRFAALPLEQDEHADETIELEAAVDRAARQSNS